MHYLQAEKVDKNNYINLASFYRFIWMILTARFASIVISSKKIKKVWILISGNPCYSDPDSSFLSFKQLLYQLM